MTTGTPRPRRTGRRGAIILAIGLVLATGFGVATTVVLTASANDDERPATFGGATEEIVLGDLQGNVSVTGTLRFADARTVHSTRSGVLTGAPTPGTVITSGSSLYSVDNVPVFLLRGDLPAWRSFDREMADGPDVLQLETSLRELGYFDGEPNQHFGWGTTDSIALWQKANGLEQTGTLPLGAVVFSSGDLRVGSIEATIGDQVGPGVALFLATSTTQVVDVDIPLNNQHLAVVGHAVGLSLPGGVTTTGVISSVGTPSETTGLDGSPATTIPVVVTLDDPTSTSTLQEASVTVEFPSDRREGVLSVPIGALIALTPDQFGVEIVDADGTTRQAPVTTGLFAGNRVEISGDDVEAGLRVVVPER